MNQEPVQDIKDRLYIIRWTFLTLKGNESESRVETFVWEDRHKALKRYSDLRVKWYAIDLRFQVAEPKTIDVNQFLDSF